MYRNPYALLRELLPEPPTQMGVIQSASSGIIVIEVLGGGLVNAKGATSYIVGQTVFFQGDKVIGSAPDITSSVEITI